MAANGQKWSDPATVIALVQLGVNAAPAVIGLFRHDPVTQKLQPMTLEELLAHGYRIDEATLMLIEAANHQP